MFSAGRTTLLYVFVVGCDVDPDQECWRFLFSPRFKMLLDGDHDEEYSVQLLKVHFCIVDVAYRSWLAYVKLV